MMVQASGRDAPGHLCFEHAHPGRDPGAGQGHTLYLLAGLGISWCAPEGVVEVVGKKNVLLKLLPPRPGPRVSGRKQNTKRKRILMTNKQKEEKT